MLSMFLFFAAAAGAAVLDYPITKKTLDNGLDLVVIETAEFKDVLSYNTLVLAGSGREEERGKTGLAHLFEHILFRHRYGGVEGGYDDAINTLGAHNNAWTWFDVTYYHPLSFTANFDRKVEKPGDLPGLLTLESERFQRLDFLEKTFKTEAGAVLGEYRRGASFPSQKLSERLAELMFPHHPYGHTTIGFYDDVVAMPGAYESAKRFYDDFYRPNNCAVILAGDVKAAEALPKLEAAYKGWKRKEIAPVKVSGEPPRKEQREHLDWDSEVAPVVWVSYRMPAFKPGDRHSAAGQLLNELLVSQAAPLYKSLRYEKRTVNALGFDEGTRGFESVDPRAVTVTAELFKEKLAERGKGYFDEVASDIIAGLDALKEFSKQPGAEDLLGIVKKKYRYDFLAELTSPERIASTFAWYYRFDRDPKVLDSLVAAVDKVTPQDIEALARAQFTPENRVVQTLAYASKKEAK